MRAYYNEIDPYAADTLEGLIRDGRIPPGDVDRRSIEDVEPQDLSGYTACHFFAGAGIWPIALRICRWPDDRPVWTGSCPCQPFSAAGKGLGVADERHLWPAFHHLIRFWRPASVFGEQVARKAGNAWINLVLNDLERDDFAVGAADLAAASVGAPQIRQRNYWFAHDLRSGPSPLAHDNGSRWAARAGRRPVLTEHDAQQGSGPHVLGHTHDARPQGQLWDGRHGGEPRRLDPLAAGSGRVAGELGVLALSNSVERDGRAGDAGLVADGAAQGRDKGDCGAAGLHAGGVDRLAYAHGWDAEQGWSLDGGEQRREQADGGVVRQDGGGPRPSPARDRAQPGPTNGFWRDADWLLCRDGKWRPVEPGTFPLVDGSAFVAGSGHAFEGKSRAEALRLSGNAICLPLAAEFIAAVREALGEGPVRIADAYASEKLEATQTPPMLGPVLAPQPAPTQGDAP